MIEFDIQNVSDGANWWRVTSGMATDEITYLMRFNGQTVRRSDSLSALISLYGCARLESPSTEFPGPEWFRVTESNGSVIVTRWDMNRSFESSFEELESSLEPSLASIFQQLDKQSTDEERNEGFEFITKLFDIDFERLYSDIMGGRY